MPEILDELLAARKRAKADLKKETDPQVRFVAMMDGGWCDHVAAEVDLVACWTYLVWLRCI